MNTWRNRSRSLPILTIIRIILPITLLMVILLAGNSLVYEYVIRLLVVERHQQLAGLAAVSVSQVLEGGAQVLETLGRKSLLLSPSVADRNTAIEEATEALSSFSAGVILLDKNGTLLAGSPDNQLAFLGKNLAELEFFQSVSTLQVPAYSDMLTNPSTGMHIVLIAVPVFDATHQYAGVLAGGLDLRTAGLSWTIRRLQVGEAGYAYLIDRQGKIIAHPDPNEIGMDISDPPFVENAMAGKSGGELWETPDGAHWVGANAIAQASGWDVVVKEPWETIIAPARWYGLASALAGGVAIFGVLVYTWLGVRRIVAPIQTLNVQTARLADGSEIEALTPSGVLEIDALEQSFTHMARQIEAYRMGLHRYINSVTQSQEEERRRIARELHDETIQSLLAVSRRLELYQASEDNPSHRLWIDEIHTMVDSSIQEVRRISRDLRPLMLEDLGLVPALKRLVREAREGQGALPQALLEVSGETTHLTPEQELTLYRITQEALGNVRKHARATTVKVNLVFEPTCVHLEIQDDGQGFEPPKSLSDLARGSRFGLMGISERVLASGGELYIHSATGQGTHLHVSLPIAAANH